MIITLTDAKLIDSQITQARLDAYEVALRQLTANKFQLPSVRLGGVTVSGGGLTLTFRDVEKISKLREGDTLQISDAGEYEEALVVIEAVAAKSVTLKADANDGGKLRDGNYPAGFATLINYPADIAEGVKRLIQYDRDMAAKLGVKSETISRMSVTYYDANAAEVEGGYPASLMSFAKKYGKIRWGS